MNGIYSNLIRSGSVEDAKADEDEDREPGVQGRDSIGNIFTDGLGYSYTLQLQLHSAAYLSVIQFLTRKLCG